MVYMSTFCIIGLELFTEERTQQKKKKNKDFCVNNFV